MVVRLTYVCWDCRRAARSTPWEISGESRCPDCQGPLVSLSPKAEIPKRSDVKGWKALREVGERYRSELKERRGPLIVERIHELERRILELEERPPNQDRDRLIAETRAKIEKLGTIRNQG